MARAGIASRRACEAIIAQGRVRVNGEVATLGQSADADVDDIRLDGEPLRIPDTFDYYILNKPKGVISDEDVGGSHPRARDLIPAAGHLYPVGRLDLDSEGLMLFTNDGELAHRLTHPRYAHPKTYRVLLEGSPSEETLDAWRRGLVIEGRRTQPAEVEKIIKTRRGTLVEVKLWEGRKRQIRKVAAALGHPALELVRVGLGPLELGDLPTGAWRRLTDKEVMALRAIRHMRRRSPYSVPVPSRDRRSGQRPERQGRSGPRERWGKAGRDLGDSDRPRRPRRSGEGEERERSRPFPRPGEQDQRRPLRPRPGAGRGAPTGRVGGGERRGEDRPGLRRPGDRDQRDRGRPSQPPRAGGADRPRRPGGAGRSQQPGGPPRSGGAGRGSRPRPARPAEPRRPIRPVAPKKPSRGRGGKR